MTTSSSASDLDYGTRLSPAEGYSSPRHLDLVRGVGTDTDRLDASLASGRCKAEAGDRTMPDLDQVLAVVEGVIVDVGADSLAVKLLDRDTVMDLPRVLYRGMSEPRYGIPVNFRVYLRSDGTRFQSLEEESSDAEVPSDAYEQMKLILKNL